MIVITYQGEDKVVRVLAEYNDDVYDTAYQDAENYFINGKKLFWMELLLTEMDGDLGTAICINRWIPDPPRSFPQHPEPSDGIMIARKISLWIAGGMIAGVIMVIVRAILH